MATQPQSSSPEVSSSDCSRHMNLEHSSISSDHLNDSSYNSGPHFSHTKSALSNHSMLENHFTPSFSSDKEQNSTSENSDNSDDSDSDHIMT